ncbi:ABC transporter [Thiocystis minor]|uniref:ABC transporter ATP-binding protein n=1 Tax=Thiocystis minor TaxID=61597 RepID=UPI0019144FD4|nr:ABC transporter ATP-binding protein [Thiocystis minor]MBK5963036.1 ABC transporter [Thiocystis minor]
MSVQSAQAVSSAMGLGKHVNGPVGGLTILAGLDLEIGAGEAVAILGASGSGKSTLLGLLAGLDDATSGEVWLCGQRIGDLDEDGRAELRSGRVGFVFQNFQLLPTLTARENILLPLELTGDAQAALRADEALERVGLTARAGHYPRQLSGGEQQRVAIARAYAPRPAVLFADEPTGNLDQVTGEHIIDLLLDLRQAAGAALVLVTHDLRLAERCDRRLRMDNGHLEPLS